MLYSYSDSPSHADKKSRIDFRVEDSLSLLFDYKHPSNFLLFCKKKKLNNISHLFE